MLDIRDHGGLFGGGGLGTTIPVFFQATQPVTDKLGAIWIEMSNAPAGKTYFSDSNSPPNKTLVNGDFLIRYAALGVDLKIGGKKQLILGNEQSNPWHFLNGFSANLPTAAYHIENGVLVSKNMGVWDGTKWVTRFLSGGYIYKEGTNPFMVEGYALNKQYTTLAFNSNHMDLQALFVDGASNIAVTTSDPIDLTGVNTVHCDWEGLSSNSSYGTCLIMAHNLKNQPPQSTGVPASLYLGAVFARTTHTLNVSALNGLYYLSFHALDTSSHSGNGTRGQVKIYNIRVS